MQKNFFIIWKGKQSQAFSQDEIAEKIKFGEISTFQKIQFNNQKFSISEFLHIINTDPSYFLNKNKQYSCLEKPNEKNNIFTNNPLPCSYLIILANILSGLSFAFCLLFKFGFLFSFLSIIFSYFIFRKIDKKQGLLTTVLTIIFSMIGYFFSYMQIF